MIFSIYLEEMVSILDVVLLLFFMIFMIWLLSSFQYEAYEIPESYNNHAVSICNHNIINLITLHIYYLWGLLYFRYYPMLQIICANIQVFVIFYIDIINMPISKFQFSGYTYKKHQNGYLVTLHLLILNGLVK